MKLSERLYSRAMQNFREGNFDEALKNIDESVQMLRKTTILVRKREGPEFERFVDAKILQGRIYLALGLQDQVDETVKYLKTLSFGTDSHGLYSQGKVYYFLYDLLHDSIDEEENIDGYLEKAKSAFAEAGYYEDAIEILFDLERSEKYKSDSDGLMGLYEEILDLNRKISDKGMKKSTNGRVRLQIAKILGRSDLKRSKKNLEEAYNDLIDNPILQIDSLIELALINIYESPKIVEKLLKNSEQLVRRDYDRLRIELIRLMLSVIVDGENYSTIYDAIKRYSNDVEVDRKLADLILEASRFVTIYGHREYHQELHEILKLAIDGFDKFNDKNGKVVSYVIDGLLSIDESERENKMKLVDVYSRSIRDPDTEYLRPLSLDMVNWIGETTKISDITSHIQRFYDHDKVKQAETLKLLAMYHNAKNHDQSQELYEDAKKLFKKSKFFYSKEAINLIEQEIV